VPGWLVPTAVAACCLAGAAVWMSSRSVAGGADEEPSAGLLAQTKEVIANLSVGVSEALGVGAEAPAMEQPAAKEPAPARRSTARTRGPSAPGPVAPGVVDLEPPSAAPEPPVVTALAAPVSQPLLEVFQSPARVPAAREVQDLYSVEDTDVSPPVLLYPQLPPPLMVDHDNGPVNRMEVVVSAEGVVERVRLVHAPTRMPDMMLLSGAKLWKFTPAYKDGEPVRYRTVLTWKGFP
jgi:hypothetical protein